MKLKIVNQSNNKNIIQENNASTFYNVKSSNKSNLNSALKTKDNINNNNNNNKDKDKIIIKSNLSTRNLKKKTH